MDILTALASYGLKQTGEDRYSCRCPAHDDKDPSLSVRIKHGDKILLRCFSGCSAEEITASLGLKISDLYFEPLAEEKKAEKKAEFKKNQFMLDYVLVKLCEATLRKSNTLTRPELNTLRESYRRLNGYSFNCDDVYRDLVRAETFDIEYKKYKALSLAERYTPRRDLKVGDIFSGDELTDFGKHITNKINKR